MLLELLGRGEVIRLKRDPLMPAIGLKLRRWAARRGLVLHVIVEEKRFTIWVEKTRQRR